MREPTLTIRPATRDDIPAIVAVGHAAVDDAEVEGFGTPSETQTFDDVARLAAAWRDPNRVGPEEVLVAERDGRVIGCTTVEDRGAVLELVNIDVDRAYQGRGIGTRLVRFVEERARAEGKEAVTLGTSRNAAGVPWRSFPWWRNRGYHVTHEEENDWTRRIGAGAREIRMRKDLVPVDRIELRPVERADLDVLFEQQRDPIAVRMAAFTARDPSDRKAFGEHWERILADPGIRMRTIRFRGRVVGSVGRFLDKDFGHPEVTYWIGKEYWGRGLATLALSEFVRQETVRPLYARAAADNVASIRVLEKCGFVLVGKERGYAVARGHEIEEVVLRLERTISASAPRRRLSRAAGPR